MANIIKTTLPFPDFKMQEMIDPEQFDANNQAMSDKINEVVDVLNTSDSSVIALGNRVTTAESNITANQNALATKLTIGANHTGLWQGLSPSDMQATDQAQRIQTLEGNFNTLSAIPGRVDTVEQKIKDVLEGLSAFKSDKDANDIYRQVDYKRGNILVKRSVLSNPVNANYTVQTITFYQPDGVTPIVPSIVYDISYDASGNVLSEVKR